jgi:hypothetical protein
MARILALILATISGLGCASKSTSAPEFDLCWALFPPGPKFDRQISEYIGTTDAITIAASCLPTFRLDAETCSRFSVAGKGQWPDDIVQWCQQYGIQLKPSASE